MTLFIIVCIVSTIVAIGLTINAFGEDAIIFVGYVAIFAADIFGGILLILGWLIKRDPYEEKYTHDKLDQIVKHLAIYFLNKATVTNIIISVLIHTVEEDSLWIIVLVLTLSTILGCLVFFVLYALFRLFQFIFIKVIYNPFVKCRNIYHNDVEA
jgi:hypothetical protein